MADPESHAALQQLVKENAEAPVCVWTAARLDGQEHVQESLHERFSEWRPSGGVDTLHLGPLGQKTSRQVLTQTGITREKRQDTCYALSDGNPWMLKEIAAASQDGDKTVLPPGVLGLAEPDFWR